MLWSIDTCQNRVSADQYYLTIPRDQVSTHRGRVFFDVIRWQIASFKWSQAYFFQWFIWNMLWLCHHGPALLRFWFQTDLGREHSASFLKIQARKTFSYHGHALVTLYVQFLYSDWSTFDRWVHEENLYRQGRQLLLNFLTMFTSWSRSTSNWSKFDRWVHADNLCSILNLVYFDSRSWQSFVSTCDVFNCLFTLDVQNEIRLLSGVFCCSRLVCLLGFWLRNTSLVKVENPISDGIVFVFTLLNA